RYLIADGRAVRGRALPSRGRRSDEDDGCRGGTLQRRRRPRHDLRPRAQRGRDREELPRVLFPFRDEDVSQLNRPTAVRRSRTGIAFFSAGAGVALAVWIGWSGRATPRRPSADDVVANASAEATRARDASTASADAANASCTPPPRFGQSEGGGPPGM